MDNISFKAQRQNFISFMNMNKLTSSAWAKKAGVSEGTIRSYIKGRSKSLTYLMLYKLAVAVNVKPADIIDGIKQEYPGLNKTYLDYCMILTDCVLEKNRLNVSLRTRLNLYDAIKSIKIENNETDDQNIDLDVERLRAMLKLIPSL